MTDEARETAGGVWIDDIEARSNLTRSQFLIWMGQRVEPASPLYNMVFAFRLRGPLDRGRFAAAFDALVAESDALRTVIEEHDGVPRQRVLPPIADALAQLDLSGEADPPAACEEWVAARARRRPTLDERLFDSTLIRLAGDDHVWFLNQHHIITDAWSGAVLCRRMGELYAGTDAGPVPAFADYVERERGNRGSSRHGAARRHWQALLERPADAVNFYGAAARGRGSRTHRVRRPMGAERSAELAAIAGADGVALLNPELSLFRVAATLVLAWLHRIGAGPRLAIGIPMHNRPTPPDKATPGLFIEVFPLVVELEAGETYVSLLRKVGVGIMDTLRHAVPGVSTAGTNTAYEVLLNFVTARMPRFADLELDTEWVHAGAGDAAHKLRLQVHDFAGDGELCVDFDFNRSVFTPAAEALAVDHFLSVVDAFIDDRGAPIAACDLFRPGERERQLVAFNETAAPWPSDQSAAALFAEQAARTPDAPALRCADTTLSYRELDGRVTALARRLADAGLGPGRVAAVLAERSVEAVVAMLASLRAGGAYLPLDVRHPPSRLAAIVEDIAESELELTGVLVPAGADASLPAGCRRIDVTLEEAGGGEAPALRTGPGDLAYLIYTSGSTGKPKGVQISQGAMTNYLWWAQRRYCGDRAPAFALHTSLAVDLTVTSIFVPLICGGTVVIYPDLGENDLPVLRVFEDDAVDVLKLTPAHLGLIREMGGRAQRIRTLILGGEDLKTDLVRAVARQFPPDLVVYNEYGPTEGTVGCMIHRYDGAADTGVSVPIGSPIANARIFLLDERGEAVPTGLTGEICIGGAGVASGYVDRPGLNAERFASAAVDGGNVVYRTGDAGRWQPEGGLAYLGRGDDQVKIRGARVELGEVEAALASHPQVRQCVAAVLGRARDEAVRHCNRCGIPSNYPGIAFNDDGVCSMCLAFDRFADQAQSYFRPRAELEALAEQMRADRRGEHDCIVLLSGGKDSTYMIYQVVAMGLKVLALTLDNGFISDGALANVRRTVEDLDLDHVMARTPHMNAIFADSLARHSNVCHGCFKTIYTLSMNEAKRRDIDYIVTGLSRGQIFETRLNDMFRHRIFDVEEIERAIIEARKVYHRIDDAVAHALDVDIFRDDHIFEQIRFVDFYRYCDVPLDEVYRFLDERAPWVRPADTGRSTNCLINDAGIYVHRKERGFHNYALPYSWDVRLGHKSREAALHELDDEIDTRRVRRILDEVGYAEKPARDEARLAVYYTADATLTAADLREHLAARLPEEMLPAHYVQLAELPLAPTGKVDRSALPAPGELHGAPRAEFVAPSTDVEQRLAEVWTELLQVPRIGVDDDFFDLGGMSLTAIQVLSRVRDVFGVELPVETFFRAPTLGEVSQAVEMQLIGEIESLSDEEVERLLGDA